MNDKLKEALYNANNPVVNKIDLYCDGTVLFSDEFRTPSSDNILFYNRLEKIFDDNGYNDLFIHLISSMENVNDNLKEAKYFDNINLYTMIIFTEKK